MRRILLSTILLSTMFLSSCLSCWKVKPKLSCDVSFKFDRCRCRCLDIYNQKTTDPKECDLDWAEDTRNFPLEQCEGIAGFYLEDITKEIIPQARKTKQCFADQARRSAPELLSGSGPQERSCASTVEQR